MAATFNLKLSDGSTTAIATGVSDATAALSTTKGDLNFMNTNKLYYLDKGAYVLVRIGSKRALYAEKTYANQKFFNSYVVSINETTNDIEMIPRNTSRVFNFNESFSNIGFLFPFSTMTAADIDNVLQNNANMYIFPRLQDALPANW